MVILKCSFCDWSGEPHNLKTIDQCDSLMTYFCCPKCNSIDIYELQQKDPVQFKMEYVDNDNDPELKEGMHFLVDVIDVQATIGDEKIITLYFKEMG